jgi:hypothetical protein
MTENSFALRLVASDVDGGQKDAAMLKSRVLQRLVDELAMALTELDRDIHLLAECASSPARDLVLEKSIFLRGKIKAVLPFLTSLPNKIANGRRNHLTIVATN